MEMEIFRPHHRLHPTLKSIFLQDNNWYRFFAKYPERTRSGIVNAVVKFLSCQNIVRGVSEYRCSNLDCTHIKTVAFTCKHRLCSGCGKKATLLWANKQSQNFPPVAYQHIVFTMPCEFWDLFWHNRGLLNQIGAIAVSCVKSIAQKKDLEIGVFVAIHTFGSALNRNVHVHLSIPLGGLTQNRTKWQKLSKFSKYELTPLWTTRMTQLLRQEFDKGELILDKPLAHLQNDITGFNAFLDVHYNRWWYVFCQEPSNDHQRNTEYLMRYVKRPVIANSRILHYSGQDILFRYFNHKTGKKERKKMSVFEFIRAVIQHIPDKGFRLVRYYGFLSNRLRGTCLPILRELLQWPEGKIPEKISYAKLIQQTFGNNPLQCILCGSDMLLQRVIYGCPVGQLYQYHKQLALGKPCY